jgi:hypothetical protein
VQFEFPGDVGLPEGRYLARDGEGEDAPQSVLVIAVAGAPRPAGRRRRRPRGADSGETPLPLPLTRATAVRAFQPFASEREAERWLSSAIAGEESVDAVVAAGLGLVNRALRATRAASGDPYLTERSAEQALSVRVGYGSGEQVAEGSFAAAHEVDVREPSGGRRQRREDDIRPQERVAAVLGGRERVDACETLLLRARLDLDAGNPREAALQLRVGLEALLAELRDALADPGHTEDIGEIDARRAQAGEAANMALQRRLDPERRRNVEELLILCERVLRRRRVLRG